MIFKELPYKSYKVLNNDTLPCPWCGNNPSIQPENPEIEGTGFSLVICLNKDCSVNPSVSDYHCENHKQNAINKWNDRPEPVLDAPAMVGSGIMHEGVKWRTVIESAQRLYKHFTTIDEVSDFTPVNAERIREILDKYSEKK